MFEVLKNRISGTTEKKQLVWNIFSLGLLQTGNYLLPLLTMPYLVRVLGPEYYGLLAFVSVTITYLMLITDYGFNLSATRQISICRDNKDKVNEIFSSVMVIKVLLLIFSFFILCLVIFSFEKFSKDWGLYFITFGMVIGQVLFPVWLFQGMEKMKFITYLNLTSKLIFTVCIFIFVKVRDDYYYVPILNSLGFVITGIYSLFLVKKEFNVIFFLPSLSSVKYQLIDGWHVFLSSIAVNLYTVSATFFLGIFTNNLIVGYFAAADKIVQAVKALYQPVSQSIFPLVGKKIHDDKQVGINFINKIFFLISLGMFFISALLFSLADPIVNLLLGKQYQRSVLLLQIMSFLPFIISISNKLGVQTMLNLGLKKAFSLILITSAILGILLTMAMVPIFHDLGTALVLLIVELFVVIVMYIYLKVVKEI